MKGVLAVVALGLGLFFVISSEEQFEKALKPTDALWDGETESTWTNQRKDIMFTRIFNQSGSKAPKAIIFFFHGMHSHSGELFIREHWFNLSKHNIVVYALDQIGHGQTATDLNRGFVTNWEYFIDDAYHFVQELSQRHENVDIPFFIAGHSLGGGISLMTSLKIQNEIEKSNQAASFWKNWLGTILLAPPITQNVSPSWIQVKVLELIHFLGGETLSLGPAPDKTKFVSEEAYVSYMTDPYAYTGRMKLGFGFTLLKFMDVIRQSVSNVKFPFLCLHGDADLVTLVDGSEYLYEHSATPKELKQLKIYEGVRHNVMTDGIAKEKAIPDILSWMNQRISDMNK